MNINQSEARVRSELVIERVLDKLSESRNPSIWGCIKAHWLSSLLIVAYGSIAWINSPNLLVVFLGIITVMFAMQSENHTRRSQEYRDIENALREFLTLVRDQAEAVQVEKIQQNKPLVVTGDNLSS